MKQKTKNSAFSKWFQEQFGKRPSTLPLAQLQRECTTAYEHYLAARYACEIVEEWETKRDAALKGWCASSSSARERA